MTEASSVLYNNIVTNFTERGALMADKDIKNEEWAAMQEDAEEVQVVVLTDDNGNEAYFMEEMIIPYEGKSFAVLVSIDEDCCEDEDCDCHHHHEEEDEDDYCIIARIDFDENGEAVYVAPTDEEYEAVAELYDQYCDEEE